MTRGVVGTVSRYETMRQPEHGSLHRRADLLYSHAPDEPLKLSENTLMTDIENLITLREKLIARRRALAAYLQKALPEQLTGESMMRIQGAIEAVNRAIEDEMRAESTHEARRRAVPVT